MKKNVLVMITMAAALFVSTASYAQKSDIVSLAAGNDHLLHRLLRGRLGPNPLGCHLRNFPHEDPRPGHVVRRLHRLGHLWAGFPNIPLAEGEPRPRRLLLALRLAMRPVDPLRLVRRSRDEGQDARRDRKVLDPLRVR